jgi:cytoskeleton protein RodZ
MSSTPFGEHLRREREMRGVSLDEISAATRISTRFLEAIEKDQWDQLPGGVFNRGFIRSIARFLGLDEDSLVAEYALGATTTAASAHVSSSRPKTEMPRNWRPAAIAVLVLIVIVAAGVFGVHRYGSAIAARLHARYLAARVGTHAGSATNQSPAPLPDPSTQGANVMPPPAATSPADPASVALTLKIQAGKPAEVKVTADGKVVFEGAMLVDDVKQFDARDTFEITSSDSSALLLVLNGQTMPAIGTPGEPGSVTLTRADLNSAAGGSH